MRVDINVLDIIYVSSVRFKYIYLVLLQSPCIQFSEEILQIKRWTVFEDLLKLLTTPQRAECVLVNIMASISAQSQSENSWNICRKGLNYGLRWAGHVKCIREKMNTILCRGNLMINGHLGNHKTMKWILKKWVTICILTCYSCSQISALCHIFKEFISFHMF
jgi:hypothetical protein